MIEKLAQSSEDALGFSANVIALTLGDELSGEIAQFVAGEASLSAGNDAAAEDGDDTEEE